MKRFAIWGLIAAFITGKLFSFVAKANNKNEKKWSAIGFLSTLAAVGTVLFIEKSKENKK